MLLLLLKKAVVVAQLTGQVTLKTGPLKTTSHCNWMQLLCKTTPLPKITFDQQRTRPTNQPTDCFINGESPPQPDFRFSPFPLRYASLVLLNTFASSICLIYAVCCHSTCLRLTSQTNLLGRSSLVNLTSP